MCIQLCPESIYYAFVATALSKSNQKPQETGFKIRMAVQAKGNYNL